MNSLEFILHDAEQQGYTQLQRHAIAEAYRKGQEEYERIVPKPNKDINMLNLYNARMELHASIKGVGYMGRHKPNSAQEEQGDVFR